MHELSVEQAEAAIAQKITDNGGQPKEVRAMPRGRGVWFAEVRLAGDERVRQGAFTEDELAPSNT